jgi:hypothetical protein
MENREYLAKPNSGRSGISGNCSRISAISGEIPVYERKLATFTRVFRPSLEPSDFQGERPCLRKIH